MTDPNSIPPLQPSPQGTMFQGDLCQKRCSRAAGMVEESERGNELVKKVLGASAGLRRGVHGRWQSECDRKAEHAMGDGSKEIELWQGSVVVLRLARNVRS